MKRLRLARGHASTLASSALDAACRTDNKTTCLIRRVIGVDRALFALEETLEYVGRTEVASIVPIMELSCILIVG
jgi:hypothetical protein